MSASRHTERKPRVCRRGRTGRFLTGLFGLLAFAGVAGSLTPANAFTRDITITTVKTWIVGADIGTNPLPKVTGPLPMTATLTPTLPNGVTFDATARTVTGTPTATFSKTRFTYTVTDADGDRIRYTLPIEVVADLTPAFAPGAAIVNQSWTAGTAIGTLRLPAASGGNAPLTYSLTPTLPNGLIFNPTARTITGTPTAAFSKTSFTYTVTDANGDTATLTFDIEVVADLTPAFAPGAAIVNQSWAEGTAISTLQLPAATGGNAPLTYSLTPAVPTGLTFNATARTVTGTPTVAFSKTSFTYTVTDGDGDTATLTFDIEVAAEPRPAFAQNAAIANQSWTAGTAISTLPLPAASGGNAPLTYSLTPTLPTGLTFNPTARTITGTPTAAFSKTSFTYTVTDANGDTATLTFDIEVAADLTPAFASGAAISAQPWTAGTAIGTLPLPAASGGNAPLTYSLTPTLPTGLTFNATARTVTGTPTATFSKTSFTYTVTDGDGDTATLTFDIEVVAAPRVTSVTFENSPASGDTYGQGETIEVRVTFNRPVVGTKSVGGWKAIELTIGSHARQASWSSGGVNPLDSMFFSYTVQDDDLDADGIGIPANAISLNGGTIRAVGIDADLTHEAVAADSARKVDGSATSAPRLTGLSVGNAPQDGATFQLGERILVLAVFDIAVLVTGGPPRVPLTIGSNTRHAAYYNPPGSDDPPRTSLWFTYTVQAGDADADGIDIPADALSLNGGAITAADGTTNAVLTSTAWHNRPVVDGNAVTAPRVIRATPIIASIPENKHTYALGEEIALGVRFDRHVVVTGTPRLAVTIGTQTRQADYAEYSEARLMLIFRYTVQAGDLDSDGIDIPANALTLNGGSISLNGTDAVLDHDAVASSALRKVDGVIPAASYTATGPWTANQAITAFGPTTTHTDIDSYAVKTGNSLPSGLTLDGTTGEISGTPDTANPNTHAMIVVITDKAGNTGETTVTFPKVAASMAVAAPVVRYVTYHNSPASGDTYRQGERIEVMAVFDIAVVVTGAPRLELTIGSDKRYANYYNPPGSDDSPETTLVFLYTVQAGDVDTDGIYIAANALSLNGGSISRNGTDAELDHDAVAANANRKVDGRTMLAPAVISLSFDTRPRNRHTYGLGELIGVDVKFSKEVMVTGSPQLGLTIGNRTRQAVYDEGNSDSWTLFFRYDAQVNDRDTDGISIAANAIDLNGGTIMAKADGATAAVLTHRALAADANRKVDGRTVLVPEVSSISFNNAPLDGDTYGFGEEIEVAVAFNASVTVTGDTKLRLLIGAERKQAVYGAGSGSRMLLFRYTVQAGDLDTDGISVPEDAISPLRGQTIAATANSATPAFLRTHALAADANRKVDGRTVLVPEVSSISFNNAPVGGDTYGFGEEIEVAIAFNVSVMVTGIPKVGLTIGNRTRQAVYDADESDGSTLVFLYTVRAGDMDTDGISIDANALSLNDGRISINAGGSISIDAKLDHDAVAADSAHKVDGVVPVVSYTDPTGPWIANQAIADLDPTTTDADTASYAVKSGSSLPPGLELDGTTGVISGTPTTVNPNTHNTVVVITDKAGNTGETTVTFPVILGDKPAFASSAAIPAQSWTEGTAIGTLQLPEATGGNAPLRYSLTPDAPTGLTFDATARTLTGTPTAAFDKTSFAYTVSDADGDTATLTFDIEVIAAAPSMRERLRRVNEAILPELARAMTASTAGAVADRLGLAAPDMGNTGSETLASIARLLQANERTLNEGDFSWRRALAGESFALGVSGDGGDGVRGVEVWGAGDWRNLSLDGPIDSDGDMFAGHLGVDAALGDGVRAGAAISRFESSVDYTDHVGKTPVAGTHKSRMTSVHPYAGLSLPDGSRLWALAGYGRGKIEIEDAEAGLQSSGSALLTAAAGAEARLLSEGATAFDLKGDAEAARLEVDDNNDRIEGLSVRTWRMRLALEGSHGFEWFPETVLTPSLELGLRWDGGDGETGVGVEIGGSLGYVDRKTGLTAEISGRALAAHEGGAREWGASGLLRLDPGVEGRGLSLSLSPSWGDAASGMARLWEDGLTGPPANGELSNGAVGVRAGAPEGRIEAELGYGLPAFDGAGLVTPYSGVAFANGGERRYRVGGRLDLGTGIDLSLEGSRRESTHRTPAEHGANLMLRMNW